jgi:AraC family transcriptional regulator of adaptative response / DNA-3-methyladenine glycosylase II
MSIELRLQARPPFAGAALLGFLRGRAIPGVEEVSDTHYARLVRVGGAAGPVRVELDPDRPGIVVRLDRALAAQRTAVVARLRRLFDLDAEPALVDAHLALDPALAPLVARAPGLRVPGALDGWELAVRAILGQQVSVRAATTLSGRLVAAFGERAGDGWWFPLPLRLAEATLEQVRAIGLPASRARTIIALGRAIAAGEVDLSPEAPVAETMDALQRVPGIGPWTASYIGIRLLRAPDLFLSGDLAARRALGAASPREAERASARWSPYRAYALMHLWHGQSGGG